MRASNGRRAARVLLLTLLFTPDGVSTAKLLAELVRQLHSRGHQLVVITTTPHYNFDPDARAHQPLSRSRVPLFFRSSVDGVPVWHVQMRKKGRRVLGRAFDYLLFHLLSATLAWTRRSEYDVILAPSPPLTTGLAAAILARMTGCSLVYNVQEIYPDVAVDLELLTSPILLATSRWIEQYVYRHSDVIVPISQRFYERLAARGVPKRKLKVIANFALDAPRGVLPQRANEFSKTHGLDGVFVLLYAGNLGLTQDFETVLDAAAKLEDQNAMRFLIVGDGARRQWLENRLNASASKNVRLLPYQPSSRVDEMYAASEVGLVPLRAGAAATTFPSKIYTIMAHARPVIAIVESESDVADLVTAAACGWTVSPGDVEGLMRTLLLAYGDPARARAMGKAGRQYVLRHHTPVAVARQYEQTFEGLQTGRQESRERR